MIPLEKLLKKFKASDLEEEKTQVKPVSGLSPVEAWELEKAKDKEADFFQFKDSFNKTIKLDD